MRQPDVSIVIPTRDRWHLLKQMGLRSALTQTGVEIEVVVVDDGSRDETAARLREIEDARLQVVTLDRSRGVACARNHGMGIARGKFIAFLDDDDAWSPHKLETQLDVMERIQADFAYASAVVLDEERAPRQVIRAPNARSLLKKLLTRNVIPSASNVVATSSLLRSLGGFDEELFLLADWDLWIRLARVGKPAACREVLLGWFYHKGSITASERDATPEFQAMIERYPEMGVTRRMAAIRAARWNAFARRRSGRRMDAARLYLRSARRDRSVGNLVRGVAMIGNERMLERARGAIVARPAAPVWLSTFRCGESRPPRHAKNSVSSR